MSSPEFLKQKFKKVDVPKNSLLGHLLTAFCAKL